MFFKIIHKELDILYKALMVLYENKVYCTCKIMQNIHVDVAEWPFLAA